MVKYTSISKYKEDLSKELRNLGEDIVEDAIQDSEVHLKMMIREIRKEDPGIRRKKAVHFAIRSFGYPSEIADVYRSFENP